MAESRENVLMTLQKEVERLKKEMKENKRQIKSLQTKCGKLEIFKKNVTGVMQSLKATNVGKKMKTKIEELECENDIFPALSGSENLHEEVIRSNLPRMVDDMELEKTLLVDQLIEDSCLTSDEGSKIRYAGDRKDQTRELCKIISRRSAKKFSVFLKRLNEHDNYPHIAQMLQSCYSKIKQKYLQNRKRMIIFETLQSADDTINSFSCLRTALSKKHPEISSLIPTDHKQQYEIKCCCKYFGLKENPANASTLPSYSDAFSSGYVKTTTEERGNVDEECSLLTVSSFEGLSKDKQKSSKEIKTNINEWMERKDEEYDKEFPDPDVSKSCSRQLSMDRSVNIVKEEIDFKELSPNLDEVAVTTFLSKPDDKNGIEELKQSSNKKKKATTKKSAKKRKNLTIQEEDDLTLNTGRHLNKEETSQMHINQSNQFKSIMTNNPNIHLAECNVSRQNEKHNCVVDSEQKSEIMFQMFQKCALAQINNEKKEETNLSSGSEEKQNNAKEKVSLHKQNKTVNLNVDTSSGEKQNLTPHLQTTYKKTRKQRNSKRKKAFQWYLGHLSDSLFSEVCFLQLVVQIYLSYVCFAKQTVNFDQVLFGAIFY
ncbi:hypothetical protein KUTeg_010709 [Tegillarca granosa]|uniref:CARD domain-containing protein n=1 Tax=Tegillarca granosa TaxID=220873 RepID=A0ABQ9F1Z4_TEGGR|nr:hypothetical protein KUTeg_010709 [Tegillarca granosa]